MKSKEQLKEIARQIFYYENIIESNASSDKRVQSAKDNIEKIMLGLSIEEMLNLDELFIDLTK